MKNVVLQAFSARFFTRSSKDCRATSSDPVVLAKIGPLGDARYHMSITSSNTVDVIVIGGGINGTGVARDCALRGLRVALFEKNDFGFGASGNNSGMIHGGPRYLLTHPQLTRESCLDSGYIQRIAPHLMFRVPFIFPVERGGVKAHARLAALDAFFAYYDRYQPLKMGKPHTLLSAADLHALEPGLVGDFIGAVTFDEWGVDGARICALNAVDAANNGAKIHTHCEVEKIIRKGTNYGDPVIGVQSHDLITGHRQQWQAPTIINATGAWCERLLNVLADEQKSTHVPLVRPGKGIHVTYERRLSPYGVVTDAIDGREIFLMPWQNVCWIATTDDDFFGDLDRITATSDEVEYLIESVSRIFPAARGARVIGTSVGARPTLYAYGKPESKLSREHAIVDHTARGAPGLFSMIGGKLASYRAFSEEMSDVIANRCQTSKPCSTHIMSLPGGEHPLSADALTETFALSEVVAARLIGRQGATSLRILQEAAPFERRVVCVCESVTACEVRHVCQHEFARTLGDVARRTRLGLGPCGGLQCAHQGAQIVAATCRYSVTDVQAMTMDFLGGRFQSRLPAWRYLSYAQEELLLGMMQYALEPTAHHVHAKDNAASAISSVGDAGD